MANGYLFSGTVNLCGKEINVSVDILNNLGHWLSQCDSRFCVGHASYLAQALTCLPDLFIARLKIKKVFFENKKRNVTV